MPLSQHILNTVKGLEFNLSVFGEDEWDPDLRTRLIDESIGLIDELVYDPALNFSLQMVHASDKDSPEIEAIIAGGKPLIEFLEKEKFLLEASGLPEAYVASFIDETKQIVTLGLEGLASPEQVFKSLIRLKFKLVEVRERKQLSGWGRAARRLAYGFGGAALVLLNASGMATSMGMFGPLAVLSGAAGGTLLDRSINGALDALKTKG